MGTDCGGCAQRATLLRVLVSRAAGALRAWRVGDDLASAIERRDWRGLLSAWDVWLADVGKSLRHARDWERATQSMVNYTADVLREHGDEGGVPAELVEALAANDPYAVAHAWVPFIHQAISGLSSRRMSEEWAEFRGGLASALQPMAEYPPAQAAEHAAMTLELAARHGVHLFFPPDPPREM